MNFLFSSVPSRWLRETIEREDEEEEDRKAPQLNRSREREEPHSQLNQVLANAALLPKLRDEKEDVDIEHKARAVKGMCVECTDQPAQVYCEQCADDFCTVCYQAQHRRGMRAKHSIKKLPAHAVAVVATVSDNSTSSSGQTKALNMELDAANGPTPVSSPRVQPSSSLSNQHAADMAEMANEVEPATAVVADADGVHLSSEASPLTSTAVFSADWFVERSKYIPLRLTLDERKFLRLLEATMNVSEYTDKVDIFSYKDKRKRIYEQLKDVCAILCGLVVASDYNLGQRMLKDSEFKDNAQFFQDVFELGRRHKVRNPEKMRGAYGKLVYLLQDSVMPEIQDLLEFNCVRPLRTVHEYLGERNALQVLKDARMTIATSEIIAEGKPRFQVDRELRAKERAVDELCRDYASASVTSEEIRTCIGSINDNHNYLRMNRDSCDKMICYLKQYFQPDSFEPGYSLAIMGGRAGARLTHDHQTQYYYCLQSLLLWREILHDMYKLWYLAEADLLDPQNPYRLKDTGQGLNRVQAASRISKAIQNIIYHVQRKVGFWVGSSVVHLGDHNVPNALMFIDKYNQVSRILNPIVITLRSIERLCEKPDLKRYIDESFGGRDLLRMQILCDFFRHAFDGSGADNFFDAGSCIDGRLTSAWNWCSKVEKKPYYPIFQLSGFNGFDGDFNP